MKNAHQLILNDLLDDWYKSCVERELSPTTLSKYRSCIKKIKTEIGALKVQEIAVYHVRNFVTKLQKTPIRPRKELSAIWKLKRSLKRNIRKKLKN